MVSVPVAVLLLYGPGSAINLMVSAELLAPVLSRRKLRPAAWLFNAGQYALSLCAMSGVFDLVEPLPAAVGTGLGDGRTLAGLVVGLAVFLAVNQALLNLDQWLSGTFHPGEALRLLAHDSFCVLIALPVSVLTVVVSLISPYAGALVTVPLAIIGHTLRLYHRMSYMQRVHRLTAELASEFDVDRICQKTAQTAAQLVFADAVCVYVLDHRSGQLGPAVVYPVEQASQFGSAAMHEEHGGMVWRVLRQAQWVYVPNVRKDPRVQRDSRVPAFQNAFQSLAVFPLHAYGRTQGALACFAVQPYAFDEEQLGYVATLTAQTAVLLENARLYQTLQEQSVRDAATGLY
ncbi:MAG: GAF domain-containing protein, partial [Alicyclobacillus sp.]|nr:GAF domain-containing protein [Alicyclobacillus sp.]